MLYSVTGKEELTLAMFEDLVKDFPKKYELYYNMVELYMASGQEEKALERTRLLRPNLLENSGK